MQNVKQYLKENQEIVYQVIQNAFKNNKISHAYLINGSSGSPVLEVAKFLAQSLVCECKTSEYLACEKCISCQKIENHSYADFIFYNGNEFKKEEILFVQNEFNKSAVEKANIKIYIIHLIEKVSSSSLNKLLKFIEEPSSPIVAIFTTNSLSSILPTILSRCQIISLKQFSNQVLSQKLIEENISEEDAIFVSKFNNDFNSSLQLLKNENFSELKEVLQKSLEYIAKQDDQFLIYMQTQGLNFLEKNQFIEIYLDMLEVCLFEALKIKASENESAFLKHYIHELTKLDGLENKIIEIVKTKKDLLSNAIKQLLMDKLLIHLIGW